MKKKKTMIAIVLLATWMITGYTFRDMYMPSFQNKVKEDAQAKVDEEKNESAEYRVNTQKALMLAAQTIKMIDEDTVPSRKMLEDQLTAIETVRPAIIAVDNETIYYQINASSALNIASDLVESILEKEWNPVHSAETNEAIFEAKQKMKEILNERIQLNDEEKKRLLSQ